LSSIVTEQVLDVRHWTDTQFTVSTTRRAGLRFENGQFVMVGMEVEGGPLTSRLQHVRPGDSILISQKPTGTLLLRDLKPGKRLYLLSTGTGVAPFMSIVKDPEVYERFECVVLVHGVRWIRETAVAEHFIADLRAHEVLGELVRDKLHYYPTITREPHANHGRLTALFESGRLFQRFKLPAPDPREDRAMVCGSPSMLAETSALLDAHGFEISPHIGEAGDYVIERAFVQR